MDKTVEADKIKAIIYHLAESQDIEDALFLPGEISFQLTDFYISFSLIQKREDEEDDTIRDKYNSRLGEEITVDEIFKYYDIKSLCIQDYVERVEGEDTQDPFSFSAAMYNILRLIMPKYDNAVNGYEVRCFETDDCASHWGGTTGDAYGYHIYINNEYWTNRPFFNFLIEISKNKEVQFPTRDYYEGDKFKIKIKFNVSSIATKTKVRRLGYFKLLLSLFQDINAFPDRVLFWEFEEISDKVQKELEVYKNHTGGVVKTPTAASSKLYVNTAVSLGLIEKLGNGYELGKIGRAYNALRSHGESPFEMDALDKAYFLESILKNDFLYIFTLLEYSYTSPNPSFDGAKKVYRQMLLKHIDNLIEQSVTASIIQRMKIVNAKKRVESWRQADEYLKHILMPRINWLYDLDLVELQDNLSYHLTEAGERCFILLSMWIDINEDFVSDSSPYLDRYFMKMFKDIYGVNQEETIVNINSLLTTYLNQSFELFKTFTENRVTFSVFANYAKWKAYLYYKVAIDINDIKTKFLGTHEKQYIFKFQNFYNDGYIQKKK